MSKIFLDIVYLFLAGFGLGDNKKKKGGHSVLRFRVPGQCGHS